MSHPRHISPDVTAFESWLSVFRRPRTVANRLHYATRLTTWAAAAGQTPWTLDAPMITAWLGTVGKSPATRKNALDAIRSYYRWAQQAGRTTMDPTLDLPHIQVPRGLPRPTPDHVLRAAVARCTRPTDILMLLLGSLSGLRVGEMAALRAEDINDDLIRVTGKGGHIRHVPVHPLLAEALQLVPSTGWLFPSDRNPTGHYLPASIAQRINDLLEPGWSAHTLRHRFATHVYSASLDILALRDLLGHADVSTTMVYTRVAAAKLARDVAAITTLPGVTDRIHALAS
ncbi:integrase [Micrococcus sp. 140720015-1]